MKQEEIEQTKVGKHVAGIRGLKTVLENLAGSLEGKPENEIRDVLVLELSRKNYIPEPVRGEHEKMFLCEYKKFVGEPVAESGEGDTNTKVVGSGWAQCDRLSQRVMEVYSQS